MKKSSISSILFMIGITAVFTFFLATLNHLTVDRIALNQESTFEKKLLYIFNISVAENASNAEIHALFSQHIIEKNMASQSYYEGYNNSEKLGYAFLIEGSGLWGNIQSVLALDPTFQQLIGIDFISHSETPGLGGRIDEPWFKEQFRNISLENEFPYISYRPTVNGSVDAISGATLTSKAVLQTMNKEIENIRESWKEVILHD